MDGLGAGRVGGLNKITSPNGREVKAGKGEQHVMQSRPAIRTTHVGHCIFECELLIVT
jgi:hypothetical protein